MENIIEKLTSYINKKGIKVVTISEPNHRSYTSHTFNYELMKSLLKNTSINTFSTEKLGVFDAMMIDYYIRNGKVFPENNFQYKGIGTKRWISYFRKIRKDRYNLVGAEFNPYEPYNYEKEALQELFSKTFIDSLFDPLDGGGEIQVETENDQLARDSFQCINDFYKNREKFWMKNIKRILEKHDNLFIVGFHLGKKDPTGRMIKKMYPEDSLFIGSCSRNITTQILLLEDDTNFNQNILDGNYEQRIEKIDKWVPPTKFEKHRSGDWQLIKVTDKNKNKSIRGVGCYVAMTHQEYDSEKKIKDIEISLKNYDMVIYMKNSIYEEDMFC